MVTYYLRKIKQDLTRKENRLRLAHLLRPNYGPADALAIIRNLTIDSEVPADLYGISDFLEVEPIDDYYHSGGYGAEMGGNCFKEDPAALAAEAWYNSLPRPEQEFVDFLVKNRYHAPFA